MSPFLAIDVPALIAALLALIACGTLGNWLVLRKESMTGDAIAHAVLPGLVAGFLITGTRSATAMFVGAAIAGVAAILIAGWVRTRSRTDAAAALGIVFTAFFAVGVSLLESRGARQVVLDPDGVLFGSLETLFYVVPSDGSVLSGVPRPLWTLAAAAILALTFSTLFAKELSMRAFDAPFTRHSGIAPRTLENAFSLSRCSRAQHFSQHHMRGACVDKLESVSARVARLQLSDIFSRLTRPASLELPPRSMPRE